MGCSRPIVSIQYEYKGVVVTRVDKDAESRFYYGVLNEDNRPDSYIYGIYPGFDGSMDGYLVFKDDKTVELVPITYFIEKGKSPKFFLKEYENSPFLNAWKGSIDGKDDNVIRISDALNIEKQRNAENHSNVNVKY